MPLASYDRFFGGKGGAAKAHRAMVDKYGDRADQVFYAMVNKLKKKRKQKSYSEAIESLRTSAKDALPVASDALAVLEEYYGRGFSAVQDGALSFEAVTQAVQAAVSKYATGEDGGPVQTPCTVLATFVGVCIYEHEGKLYQVDYSLSGTDAELVGEAEEVVGEFKPVPQPLGEHREAPLIEARPAGAIQAGQINRALNVIEGTVLITSQSVNGGKGGRRYSDQALKQIAAMAEGLPAYLNHVAVEHAFKPRDVRDLIGTHRNVRYHPHEGRIVSDLHVAAHQAPIVFGLAETLGGHIGNSLVSKGLVQMEGETEVVKEVHAVRSADLVSDPATTKGLFESRVDDPDPFATLITELRESLTTALKEAAPMDLAAILSFLKDKPGDQKVLAEHFGFVPKPEAEKLQEQIAALTAEREVAAKQVVDLEAVRVKALADLSEAQVALDGYKAKDALAEKRAKIVTVIEAHDLGKQFGKIKDAVSDTFKTLLERADETQWASMLDDRFKALKGVPSTGTPRSDLKPDALLREHQDQGVIAQEIYDRLAAAVR